MDNSDNESLEERRLRERLDQLVSEYTNKVDELDNLIWKITRKRKEITTVCNKLGYDINEIDLEERHNDNKEE